MPSPSRRLWRTLLPVKTAPARSGPTPEQMRVADAALRAMRSLPVPPEVRLLLLTSLSTFVRGHAAVMRQVLDPAGLPGEGSRALVREVATPGRFPDLAPLVASGMYLGEAPEGMPAPDQEADPAQEELSLGLAVWFEGVAAAFGDGDAPTGPPEPPSEPEHALEAAEAELRAAVALRKATQRRVQELERREQALRRARDAAKEAGKAAERATRAAAKGA